MYGSVSISRFMVDGHKSCDESLADVERAIKSGSEDRFLLWDRFFDELIRHFSMEELVLFPALNDFATKHRLPLRVMEMEHEKMRGLLGAMGSVLDDKEKFFSLSETLMVLLQQHNIKEEAQVYTPADELLGEEAGYVLSQMRGVY